MSKYSVAERLRMSFEQLGPTFIKFGQLLAARPDLIPQEFSEEFKKLHNQVSKVNAEDIQKVLHAHFGKEVSEVFSDFDEKPLAAASIAQVYRAKLKSGEPVVVKVQKPGVPEIIEEDLSILFSLAQLLEDYIHEARIYNPVGVVNEFAKSLAQETNFVIEANNIRRFHKNFDDEEQLVIPRVYSELSGKRVLVLEELQGIPLSHKNALHQEGIRPEEVLKSGLKAYLKMVFKYGLFHGDLHAGNMFVLPENKIGLIDFGVVGRLNKRSQDSIANILLALASEDYDRLAYEYVDLAPYSGHVDIDRFARELRDLIAPYYGLTLRNINVGRMLMDATALAARYKLTLPTELVMFFKSIVSIENMGRLIDKDFDFLQYSLDFAAELIQSRYEPKTVFKDFSLVIRDTNSLVVSLPRYLKQLLKRLNSPDFSANISISEIKLLKKGVEKSSNLLFLGLVIGSLLLSASILATLPLGEHQLLGLPIISVVGYSLAAILGLAAFINYIRKS